MYVYGCISCYIIVCLLLQDQAHFNIHMQQTVDTIQSMLTSLTENRGEGEIAILNIQESISTLRTSLANLQFGFDNMKEEMVELKALAVSSNAFCSGKLTWRISNVRQRVEEAQLGRMVKIFSHPFYTEPDGYKMCLIVYLNGRGAGEGTHLSVFFGVMKGEYDPLLRWPFEHRISLTLVDQDKKGDITHSFNPAGQDNPFSGPTAGHEVSSFSGYAKFAPLSILSDPKYVRNDVMFIRATADVDDYYSTILV